MKYQVQLTAKAERDVDQILHWFHEQHATAAGGRWLMQILSTIDTLEKHPERCGLAAEAEELGLELRELLFGKRHGKYRILFIVRKNVVSILHIRHTARDAVLPEDVQ